jgi:NitT/TauT family transport system substrate-binding protein
MYRRRRLLGVSAAAAAILMGGLAACSSGGAGTSNATGTAASSNMPTVSMMVGGLDKQIYLPYQLAQGLGYYRKYGVNMQLSTQETGGVAAETAMVSGQVDMAGTWYVGAIDLQSSGKQVENIVQLSGAPGENEMCATGTKITSPAQWRGQALGVTSIGSGTDDLTLYLAARYGLTSKDFTVVAAGDGDTMIAAIQHHRIACGMTTQPTVAAIENQSVGYSAFDLSTSAGVQKWLGGTWPSAGVLARTSWINSNRATVQKVVDALVATMHWIATHSAAQIAAHLPANFVSSSLSSSAQYIQALTAEKSQFLPNGMMPAGGPQAVLATEKEAGRLTGPVNLSATYTNSFAANANKLEGFSH